LVDEVAQRDLLLAGMPPCIQPTPHLLPIRNRVIDSVAIDVVVADAAHRSGSLITQREAANHGSDVTMVRESQLTPRSDGYKQLIRDSTALGLHATNVIECVGHQTQVEIPPVAVEWADGMR
jgi:DNA processing protein